jgi:hypothetical protein
MKSLSISLEMTLNGSCLGFLFIRELIIGVVKEKTFQESVNPMANALIEKEQD